MTHGSLFSGIGGFDLASEWNGWENIFHCEIEEFPRTILKYYWPDSISYEDITKTDFTIHRGQIDVLTGGFPCQPYSHAGKRKGKEDDRHLWPEMLRSIREIQPVWIVGENVPGIISWNGGLVFEEVCADLEDEGYEVQPVILPAVSKDAPHRRDRVWFVAYSTNARLKGVQSGRENGAYGLNAASDTSFQRCDHRSDHREERQVQGFKVGSNPENKSEWNGWIDRFGENGSYEHTTDTRSQGLEGENRPRESIRFTPGAWDNFPTQPPVCGGDARLPGKLVRYISKELQNEISKTSKKNRIENLPEMWKKIQQKEVWEKIRRLYSVESKEILLETMQLYSTESEKQIKLSPFCEKFSEKPLRELRKYGEFRRTPQGRKLEKQRESEHPNLMPQLPHEVALAARRYTDTIRKFNAWHRQESIKGYGNAVVPQVVYEIFKVIEKMQ